MQRAAGRICWSSGLRLALAVVLSGVIGLSTTWSGLVLAAGGDLDPNFGDGSLGPGKTFAEFRGFDEANAVAIQPNGYIVVVGEARTDRDGASVISLARFTPNGALDASFGVGGKAVTQIGEDSGARAVAIQPDGKIIVVGYSYSPLFRGRDFAVVRYNPDGTLDPTFGGGGAVLTDFGGIDEANAVALQLDGKIVVAGSTTEAGIPKYFALARYEPGGQLDLSFGYGGQFVFDGFLSDTNLGGATGVALQRDGNIVVVGPVRRDPGYVNRNSFGLLRLTAGGAPDTTFGNGGHVTTAFGEAGDGALAVAIQADGKIVAAGYTIPDNSSDEQFGLARYNPDGSLDTSFSDDGKVSTAVGGAGDDVYALAIQADGKIVAAGLSYTPTQAQRFGVARFNPSGTLDTSFSGDGKLTTNFGGAEEARALAIQPDGKILVVGPAELNSGSRFFVLARYLAQ